jgi:methanethiol oxidase
MASIFPEETLYPSPKMAMEAPAEQSAYVAVLHEYGDSRPDAMVKIDLEEGSSTYGQIIDRLDLPFIGDELHHFSWNSCSSALCPFAAHPHVPRRYLIVPGIRSSRLYVIDTKGKLKIEKIITPEEIHKKTGYSRLHTIHCGIGGIYVSALGNPDGGGPGGIFLLDHNTYDVLGKWEIEKGSQFFSYDFWWHLGHDTLVTSEWGTPNMFEDGLIAEKILNNEYGHQIHFWSLSKRKHLQTIDFGKEQQMVLELRPAHDPAKAYGFASVVISTENLSSSVFVWYLDGETWKAKKVIEIPAVPNTTDKLPQFIAGFQAVPPLVTDIVLSVDDRFLYVSCWGTGEFHQYDVSDPFNPKLCEILKIGGIVNRTSHPSYPDTPLNGGPQMVECSRSGKHLYFTNSLYSTIDDQFYTDGMKGWMVKINTKPEGGMEFDSDFFIDFGDERPHQIRLEGGDASSDSYWFS